MMHNAAQEIFPLAAPRYVLSNIFAFTEEYSSSVIRFFSLSNFISVNFCSIEELSLDETAAAIDVTPISTQNISSARKDRTGYSSIQELLAKLGRNMKAANTIIAHEINDPTLINSRLFN